VRFISNPSSGRQGFALAQAALERGAEVTLITGPTDLPTPVRAQRVDVITARDMLDAVLPAVEQADALLMAAAPGDYAPAVTAPQKIKKGPADLTLHLTRTVDVLNAIAAGRADAGRPRVVVGFAAESEDLVRNAEAKLETKRLDLIVANDVTARDAGFAVETNRVVLLDRRGGVEQLPVMTKAAVAEIILDRVVRLLSDQG
jgi:phosphopantothenoylcysteine decarboxylase/phosphopantothenate--cysteine ligase